VDRWCEALFLSHRARERDDNLLFVRDRLLRSETDVASLLSLYARIRSQREQVADDRTIRHWKIASRREAARLHGHRAHVHSVAFSPDGNTLAAGSADGRIRLWRAASFAETNGPHGTR
jgi:WD40 repeat protein